jgi:hypothetical protein
MTPTLHPNHKWASIKLYDVVALNTITESEYTSSRLEAAQELADLLQIDRRAPKAWLRGDFKKHPLSLENFWKFVRAYRGKPGLETSKEITALAINLYGMEY